MRRIAFYVSATGEIVSVIDYATDALDADIDTDTPAGAVWLECDADPETDYIPSGVLTERPDFGALHEYHVDADGVQRTLFTMPSSSTVTYQGVETTAGSNDFIFSSVRNGEFEFSIEVPFPYLPVTVKVIADAV